MKYRHKPVVVDVLQYTGDNLEELIGFADIILRSDGKWCVYTPEGLMAFDIGDYIIKGVKGEFYPCKQDIFEETYERVRE